MDQWGLNRRQMIALGGGFAIDAFQSTPSGDPTEPTDFASRACYAPMSAQNEASFTYVACSGYSFDDTESPEAALVHLRETRLTPARAEVYVVDIESIPNVPEEFGTTAWFTRFVVVAGVAAVRTCSAMAMFVADRVLFEIVVVAVSLPAAESVILNLAATQLQRSRNEETEALLDTLLDLIDLPEHFVVADEIVPTGVYGPDGRRRTGEVPTWDHLRP